ncbi:MAG: ABC transporter permease [Treponemataceae bacterium]|nr:ABC transporter permease [Treponemataceae bacterium]
MGNTAWYEILEISSRSLIFALTATLFALSVGVPFGFLLGRPRTQTSALHRCVVSLVGALTALPTVTLGLMLYLLFSRSGPLGFLNLLYKPGLVILGETLLALPLVIHHLYSGLHRRGDSRTILLHETLITFGAKGPRYLWTMICEKSSLVWGAATLAFGRILGEVGLVMMVGGNIRFLTRTMTTTIALETSRGNLQQAGLLGILLVGMALVINGLFHWFQDQEENIRERI